MKKKRKWYKSQEKVVMLKQHLLGNIPVWLKVLDGNRIEATKHRT